MVKVACWNIAKKKEPWHCLVKMAERREADVAILQEAGHLPGDLIGKLEVDDKLFWHPMGFDRLPLVVKLSDNVTVETYRQVPLLHSLPADAIGVSDIGTIAAAKVTPVGKPNAAFIAISMYARWLRPHPSTGTKWSVGYPDGSAHRIISDLSTFIGSVKPSKHRILAGGDLNMAYGTLDKSWESLALRERTVYDRMEALGFQYLGLLYPAGRKADPNPSGLPMDTLNVPTFYSSRGTPASATVQLDHVFASKGFHENVRVRALNSVAEWGPSDHCRLMIEVATDN